MIKLTAQNQTVARTGVRLLNSYSTVWTPISAGTLSPNLITFIFSEDVICLVIALTASTFWIFHLSSRLIRCECLFVRLCFYEYSTRCHFNCPLSIIISQNNEWNSNRSLVSPTAKVWSYEFPWTFPRQSQGPWTSLHPVAVMKSVFTDQLLFLSHVYSTMLNALLPC